MQRPEDFALPCWTSTALRTGDLSITHTHTHHAVTAGENLFERVWIAKNRLSFITCDRYMYRQVHKHIYLLFICRFFPRHLSDFSSYVLLMLTNRIQCKGRPVRGQIQTQNSVMRTLTRASRHFWTSDTNARPAPAVWTMSVYLFLYSKCTWEI